MTLSPDKFQTHSLRKHGWGDQITRVLAASLTAVEPGALVRKSLKIKGDQLNAGNLYLDLKEYERVLLVAIGKASFPMAVSAVEILSDKISQGIILSKTDKEMPSNWMGQNITKLIGGHPIPTQESLNSTSAIKKMLSALSTKDLVIVLLSGGGSSLLSSPVPGISLSDLQIINQVLLRSGAPIEDINTVRKHISSVKGGQLAKISAPARVVTLILSDVIGDPLDMIASGPTMPDTTSYKEALYVMEKYQLKELMPDSVIKHLYQGKEQNYSDNPKPDDPIFDNVTNIIIGNNQVAVTAGLEQAKTEGFNTIRGEDRLEGEAELVGFELAKTLRSMANAAPPPSQPVCLISGGETTVTLPSTGSAGNGGRNLETALSALIGLNGIEDAVLITLASDGEDGTTGAAGGVVTGESYQRAKEYRLDPEQELKNHNSYLVFDKLDDLLQIGPTLTNVNDLCFLFTF